MGWLILSIFLCFITGLMLIAVIYILKDIQIIVKNMNDMLDKLEYLRRY